MEWPIRAEIETVPDLRYGRLSLSDVRRHLEFTQAAVSVIVLDACLDSPLAATLSRSAVKLGQRGRKVMADKGLAAINVAPASGMLVAYATAP